MIIFIMTGYGLRVTQSKVITPKEALSLPYISHNYRDIHTCFAVLGSRLYTAMRSLARDRRPLQEALCSAVQPSSF